MGSHQTRLLAFVAAASALVACHSAGGAKGPGDAAVGGDGGRSTGGTTVAGSGGDAGAGSGGTGGTSASQTGGNSGTGTSDGSIAWNATEVCRTAIQAHCEREAFCMNYPAGQLRDCRNRASLCPDYYFGADSNRSVAEVADCIAKIAARPCTDIPLFVFPSCLAPGKRPAGAGCAFSSQCQSGLCSSGNGETCSTCAASAAAGSKCPDTGLCQLGTYCNPKTKVCTDPGTIAHAAEGQPCDLGASPLVACEGDLFCERTSYGSSSAGTCTRGRSAGQSCSTPAGEYHVCSAGTVCMESTGGTCELPGACGVGVRCDTSAYCRTGDGGVACAPRAPLGQACITSSTDGLPPCLEPAVCPPSTGKCVLPRALGETCDANNPCDTPLSCKAGTCQKLTALACPA